MKRLEIRAHGREGRSKIASGASGCKFGPFLLNGAVVKTGIDQLGQITGP